MLGLGTLVGCVLTNFGYVTGLILLARGHGCFNTQQNHWLSEPSHWHGFAIGSKILLLQRPLSGPDHSKCWVDFKLEIWMLSPLLRLQQEQELAMFHMMMIMPTRANSPWELMIVIIDFTTKLDSCNSLLGLSQYPHAGRLLSHKCWIELSGSWFQQPKYYEPAWTGIILPKLLSRMLCQNLGLFNQHNHDDVVLYDILSWTLFHPKSKDARSRQCDFQWLWPELLSIELILDEATSAIGKLGIAFVVTTHNMVVVLICLGRSQCPLKLCKINGHELCNCKDLIVIVIMNYTMSSEMHAVLVSWSKKKHDNSKLYICCVFTIDGQEFDMMDMEIYSEENGTISMVVNEAGCDHLGDMLRYDTVEVEDNDNLMEVKGDLMSGQEIAMNEKKPPSLKFTSHTGIFSFPVSLLSAFRQSYANNNLLEVTPPCMVQTQVEGGAMLFKFNYYGQPAFLMQSFQLYLETLHLGELLCQK
ncbi:hypothetical protein BDR04DRAFT_1188317 [Suillus decipiens]|nr:hypothetical protein BDR04DRAFT_1188317 [Suillus decipiens]